MCCLTADVGEERVRGHRVRTTDMPTGWPAGGSGVHAEQHALRRSPRLRAYDTRRWVAPGEGDVRHMSTHMPVM